MEEVYENVSQGSSQLARLTPKWVSMDVMSSTGKVLVLSVQNVEMSLWIMEFLGETVHLESEIAGGI